MNYGYSKEEVTLDTLTKYVNDYKAFSIKNDIKF